MKWKKRGFIFSPVDRYKWMHNHAQCPFPLDFGNFIRVYFATREAYQNNMCRAYGGFIDLDKNDLKKILNVSSRPLMELGGIGEFDEFGIMPTSVVRHNDEYYLYYIGWSRGFSVPYDLEIGFAKSKDGEKFEKIGKGPLLGPTLHEPYLNTVPIVYKFEEDNWYMFYASGVQWVKGEEKMESQYLLMQATSTDGIKWSRDSKPIIETKVEFESQASASIIKIDGKYHMFFCYRCGLDFRYTRNRGYQIGYAVSDDLISWTRDDSKAGIDVSESGWDSEMMAYPHIAKINDKYIMFYCGNHFGRDGFGYAELEI